jgi:hypothetical protein
MPAAAAVLIEMGMVSHRIVVFPLVPVAGPVQTHNAKGARDIQPPSPARVQ